MSIQVLTSAPGGYVEMKASEIIRADYWRTGDDVRVRFRNGDFVIVSGDVARSLGRLGIIPPCSSNAAAERGQDRSEGLNQWKQNGQWLRVR